MTICHVAVPRQTVAGFWAHQGTSVHRQPSSTSTGRGHMRQCNGNTNICCRLNATIVRTTRNPPRGVPVRSLSSSLMETGDSMGIKLPVRVWTKN